jgi:hypothetical protein
VGIVLIKYDGCTLNSERYSFGRNAGFYGWHSRCGHLGTRRCSGDSVVVHGGCDERGIMKGLLTNMRPGKAKLLGGYGERDSAKNRGRWAGRVE